MHVNLNEGKQICKIFLQTCLCICKSRLLYFLVDY